MEEEKVRVDDEIGLSNPDINISNIKRKAMRITKRYKDVQGKYHYRSVDVTKTLFISSEVVVLVDLDKARPKQSRFRNVVYTREWPSSLCHSCDGKTVHQVLGVRERRRKCDSSVAILCSTDRLHDGRVLLIDVDQAQPISRVDSIARRKAELQILVLCLNLLR